MNFSTQDTYILREGISRLQFWERQILIYRYWENLTIEEIANLMNMKCSEVDMSLEKSYSILRKFCLNESSFGLYRRFNSAA